MSNCRLFVLALVKPKAESPKAKTNSRAESPKPKAESLKLLITKQLFYVFALGILSRYFGVLGFELVLVLGFRL